MAPLVIFHWEYLGSIVNILNSGLGGLSALHPTEDIRFDEGIVSTSEYSRLEKFLYLGIILKTFPRRLTSSRGNTKTHLSQIKETAVALSRCLKISIHPPKVELFREFDTKYYLLLARQN